MDTPNVPHSSQPSATLNIRSFVSQIAYFNGMYGLPLAPYPTVTHEIVWQNGKSMRHLDDKEALTARLSEFQKILTDEVNEVNDIIECLNKQEYPTELDFLTDMADWLGDMIVYCASEMARYGIPFDQTLRIIMQSNFSKLGADGKPIIKDGKVQKGPNYWRPEPLLRQMLENEVQFWNSHRNVSPAGGFDGKS